MSPASRPSPAVPSHRVHVCLRPLAQKVAGPATFSKRSCPLPDRESVPSRCPVVFHPLPVCWERAGVRADLESRSPVPQSRPTVPSHSPVPQSRPTAPSDGPASSGVGSPILWVTYLSKKCDPTRPPDESVPSQIAKVSRSAPVQFLITPSTVSPIRSASLRCSSRTRSAGPPRHLHGADPSILPSRTRPIDPEFPCAWKQLRKFFVPNGETHSGTESASGRHLSIEVLQHDRPGVLVSVA